MMYDSGMLIPRITQTPLFEDQANRFLLQFGESTRVSYSHDLKCWFEFSEQQGFDPLTASTDHLSLFMRHNEEILKLSKPTSARRMAAIGGFYKKMRQDGVRMDNPAENVRRPTFSNESVAPGVDQIQIGLLLRSCYPEDARSYALIHLLALNGLRISEALGLDIEDLGYERGIYTMTILRKGSKTATVAMTERAHGAIIDYIEPRISGPIFVTSSGARWTRGNAWAKIRDLSMQALGRPLHPHDFRHAFVTNCLDAGIPLHEVQDAVGHASPVTTQRYNAHRNRIDNAPTFRLAEAMGLG